jgi:hypothetical protein
MTGLCRRQLRFFEEIGAIIVEPPAGEMGDGRAGLFGAMTARGGSLGR